VSARVPVLDGATRGYESRPLATAAVVFAALAVLRVAGAWSETLLVVAIALTGAVVLTAPRSLREDIGLRRITSWRGLVIGCAAVIASYALTVGACVLLLGTGPDNWASALLTVFDGTVPESVPGSEVLVVVVAVLCLGLLVPLAEEVCYRGLLLHAVAQRYGAAAGVAVTSAGWALVHLGDYGLHPFNPVVAATVLPSVFVMGLALGWCRLASGSVLGSTAAQGTANLLLAGWVLLW
jgi:membrane protease YdiL (CAAX protease family)